MEMNSANDKENILSPSSTFNPPPTPLLKKIGFGTGVSVYHLDRSPCNRTIRSPWALKTVNRNFAVSHFQDRLESEAKILQGLKHPNIVGFRGFSKTDDGRKVLAMEECTESLGDLIEGRTIRFEPVKILTVIAGIAKALQYLHEEKGLLHGDIKSYNILIKGDFEEVKLCDFGVSLDLKTANVEDHVGTGAWSAPEILGDGPLTDKADIFSLGLVIWEMLTLKPPNLDLDKSSVYISNSSDDSLVELEEHFGKTPPLPVDLPLNYALVAELYEWCSRQEWDQRPAAQDILNKLVENGFPLTKAPVQITL